MFDVYFKYADGNEILCKDITKIEYSGSNGYVQVSGDQLLTTRFRISGDLFLLADDSNHTVTSKGLLHIQVTKK